MWSKKTRKEYLRAWGEYDRDERPIPREAAVVADMTWYDFCWAVRRQRWRDEQTNDHIRTASLQALSRAAARPTEGTTPGKRKFSKRDNGCRESKPVRRKLPVLLRPRVHEICETAPPDTGPDVCQAEHVWYWEEEPCRPGDHSLDRRGNFVAYPPRLSDHIELEYAQRGDAAPEVEVYYKVSLPVLSTDRAQKFHEQTGTHYRIDFANLVQINFKTGWKRAIRRLSNQRPLAASSPRSAPPSPN